MDRFLIISRKVIATLLLYIVIVAFAVQPVNSAPVGLPQQLVSTRPVSRIGQYGGIVKAIAVQENWAFLGQGARLVVLDITDPAHPMYIWKSFMMAGNITSIVIKNNYLYASDSTVLYILNITIPNDPQMVSVLNYGGYIAISGMRLYLTGSDALHIFDISSPASPSYSGSFPLSYGVRGTASGNVVFVLDGTPSGYVLHILDTTDPGGVVELGIFEDFQEGQYPSDIALAGNDVLISHYTGLKIIDVSDLANPTLNVDFHHIGFFQTLAVSGNTVITGDFHDIYVYELDNNGYPVKQGTLECFGSPVSVAIDGDLAFLGGSTALGQTDPANLAGGLGIVDISQPATPQLQGVYRGTVPNKLIISSHKAYYINFDQLEILNVVNPDNPVFMGAYQLNSEVKDMAIDGNFAYLVVDANLMILDVSDPASIQPRGIYSAPSFASNVELSGGFAYLTEGDDGLQIIDVTNPDQPTVAATLDSFGETFYYIHLEGGYAYLSGQNGYLRILDIADPLHPEIVGTSALASYADKQYAVSNEYVFYLDFDRPPTELVILNATDKAAIVPVGSFGLAPAPQCVTVSENVAYICNSHIWGGLRVLDVSDPASPVELIKYHTPGEQRDIDVKDGLIYVNDHSDGLLILKLASANSELNFLPFLEK